MKVSIFTSGKPIGICCDHAGYEIKSLIINLLDSNGVAYIDFGTNSTDSCDYPDYAHKLGAAIDKGECEYGIAVCGSGNGINMVMNKHQSVRAALCWTAEIAELARKHNNANVLTLPGRFVSEEEASAIATVFFNTNFESGRHQKRIDKIPL